MAWPDDPSIWGRLLGGAQANIAMVAQTIGKYEPVIVCANAGSAARARTMCGPAVTVISSIPVNDCWMRDIGPIFRTNGAGSLDAVGLNFNGWGNKQVHHKDQHVARNVAAHAGVPFAVAGFAGEGGAIETDGAGTVLATQSSLVNSDRNPGMSQAQVQAAVLAAYGARKMIWFPGIAGQDITDDHVDATSRFAAPATALVEYPLSDDGSIWGKDERQQYQTLSASTDARGSPIRVTKVLNPRWSKIRQRTSNSFVDSYVNYYVCNGAVICAQFGDPAADAAARAAFASMFHGRVIEQLNIDSIGLGGGGVHCVTQPEPLA